MAGGVLFDCSFEGGPIQDWSGTVANFRRSFASQDIYVEPSSVNADTIQDADGGGDVGGNGRYACRPVNAGLGSVTTVSGHVVARTQTTIWWAMRVKLLAFTTVSNIKSADVYILARCLDSTTTPPSNYWGITFKMNADASHAGKFCVSQFDSTTNNHVAIAITGTTTYTAGTDGHVWVCFSYDTSTGDLELFLDDSSEGTNTAGLTGRYSEGEMLYGNALSTGKGSEAGCNPIFSHLHSTDAGKPSKETEAILYQPDCEVETDWTPTAGKEGFETVDDENDAGADSGDIIGPGSVADRHTFRFKGGVQEAGGTAVVKAVRLICHQEKNLTDRHTISAWIDGSSIRKDYTNPLYGYADAVGGAEIWTGRLMPQTPEATPQEWAGGPFTLFDKLRAGVHAITNTEDVGEFYAIAIGEDLDRPTATVDNPAACTTGETVPPLTVSARRIFIT